jgi:hypothetical protein
LLDSAGLVGPVRAATTDVVVPSLGAWRRLVGLTGKARTDYTSVSR